MSHASAIWNRAKGIVGEASELPAEDRHALIEARCAGDQDLRREVESLLAAVDSSQALLHPDADAWVGAMRQEVTLPVGGRLGSFEILRLLAEAPGSAVYEARQMATGRVVALKLLRTLPLLGPDPRFMLEAKAASRVEHPNVVRVYEVGVVDAGAGQRVPFIAMELVDGVPITRFARDRRLGTWEVVDLLRRVVSGVARIHQCGVIHRDLKPSNVLVDRDGEPRVLDFGIARLVAAADQTWRTREGELLGTPGYISPEQVRDPSVVDVRADVWALGAMAYELLGGAPPFPPRPGSALESLRRVAEEDPVPLRRIRPHIPPDLEAVVMKAIARRPEDRYASATELAEDLDNARHHRPVRARRSTLLYRAGRLARRRAVPLAASIALLGAGVGLGTGQVLSWRDAARQRDRAGAALGVVRDMISSADPNFGQRDVLMRDVLASLDARLDQTPDPLIEAEVRSLLGGMSFGLGEYERSRALFERAIALREQAGLGRTPEATLDRAALAQALRWLYRPDEALAVATPARDDAHRRLGPDHPATLTAREVVAGCWHDLGRREEAAQEYRRVIEARARAAGPRDRGVLIARGNLAALLGEMGRYAAAEAELRVVLEGWEHHPGALEAITTGANLAQVMAEQGRLDEAVARLERVIVDARAALGPGHPTTVTARTNLVEFHRRQGNEGASLEVGAALVDECRAALGASHDLTLTATTGQIAALIRAGRGPEAVALVTTTRDACLPSLAPASPWRPRLDASMAAALASVGRHDQSVALYRSSIAQLEASLGADHRQTLVARNNLGVALIDAAEPNEAARLLDAVLDTARRVGYSEMYAVVQRNLGRALLASGRSDEGVAALQSSFLLSLERRELGNASECARLLAEHHDRAGDPVSAERWRALEADPAAPG
jgi:tetratricopeptide (TPR) repeat protein